MKRFLATWLVGSVILNPLAASAAPANTVLAENVRTVRIVGPQAVTLTHLQSLGATLVPAAHLATLPVMPPLSSPLESLDRDAVSQELPGAQFNDLGAAPSASDVDPHFIHGLIREKVITFVPRPQSTGAALEHAQKLANTGASLAEIYDLEQFQHGDHGSHLSEDLIGREGSVFLDYPAVHDEETQLGILDRSLAAMHLKPHTVRVEEGPADSREQTVVIYDKPWKNRLAMVREGNRQSPGNVFLALDRSWVTQEVMPDGRTRTYLRKGMRFNEHGAAEVVEFISPRPIYSYADDTARPLHSDNPLEHRSVVPNASSLGIRMLLQDRLSMTALSARTKAFKVRKTLGFAFAKNVALLGPKPPANVTVLPMPEEANIGNVALALDEFIRVNAPRRIVVKPSGPNFRLGQWKRTFNPKKKPELQAAIEYIQSLSKDLNMTEEGAVIVQEDNAIRSKRKDVEVRIFAARTPWGSPVVSDMFARVVSPNPKRDESETDEKITMEELFGRWGNVSKTEARALQVELESCAKTMMQAIMDQEASMNIDGLPDRAQSYSVAFDVAIERRGGKLVPVLVRVQDHNATGQHFLDEASPEKMGAHSREAMASMLKDASDAAMRNRTVVVVGAGYSGKQFFLDAARRLGLRVVLVDILTSFARGMVDLFIPVTADDYNNHGRIPQDAVVRALAPIKPLVDGVATIWEDDIANTARLAQALGAKALLDQETGITLRSKLAQANMLAQKKIPVAPFRVFPNLNEARNEDGTVNTVLRQHYLDDALTALTEIGYPIVVKPVFGGAAIGTIIVNNASEARKALVRLEKLIIPTTDPLFGQGTSLFAQKFLSGDEFDVDFVMVKDPVTRKGRIVFASVTDNDPTVAPYFIATGSELPSRTLSEDAKLEIIQRAEIYANALGMTEGVGHLEGKWDEAKRDQEGRDGGFGFIELNGRVGGEYVHSWVKAVWGVDLGEETWRTLLGKGVPYASPVPLIHLKGRFDIPDGAGILKRWDLPAEYQDRSKGFFGLRQKKVPGQKVVPPPKSDRIAMIEAWGTDFRTVEENLARIWSAMISEIDYFVDDDGRSPEQRRAAGSN